MLTENDVIQSVAKYLCEEEKYEIIDTKSTNEQGHDIIAKKERIYLFVEAKGQTSSKPNTRRYGKEFTANQKYDHVSKAVYTALKNLNSEEKCEVGIAIPADEIHLTLVNDVFPSLTLLNIKVFVVSNAGNTLAL